MDIMGAALRGMVDGTKAAGKKLGLDVVVAKQDDECEADDCFGCLMLYEDDNGIGRCGVNDIE